MITDHLAMAKQWAAAVEPNGHIDGVHRYTELADTHALIAIAERLETIVQLMARDQLPFTQKKHIVEDYR